MQEYPPLKALPPLKKDLLAEKGLSMPRVDGAGSRRFPLAKSVLQAFPEAALGGKPYPVKALLLYYANPAFSSPVPDRFYKAFKKIPFIVSFSPFMDESTLYADIVLPDHTYLERWQDDPGLATFGYPFFGIRQPVVKPLYNTRHTGDAIISLAKAIGGTVGQAFPWKDFKGLLLEATKGIMEAARGNIVGTRFEGEWYQFLEKRGWRAPTYRSFEEFWKQMLEKGGWWAPSYQYGRWERVFRTPSRKFEFYSQLLKARLQELAREEARKNSTSLDMEMESLLKELEVEARGDKVFLPHYESPRFVGNKAEYPFHLNTFKLITHAGGKGANQPFLQEITGLHVNKRWDSWVEINPQTAKKLGISDGDLVWVESPVGKIKARAKTYPGAMPDVVNIPYEEGHTAYGRWAKDRGVNPNWLIAKDFDCLAGNAAWFSTRVKVYRAEEET